VVGIADCLAQDADIVGVKGLAGSDTGQIWDANTNA